MHYLRSALVVLTSAIASGCTANARFDIDSAKPLPVEKASRADAPVQLAQPTGDPSVGNPSPRYQDDQVAEPQQQKLGGRAPAVPREMATRGWKAQQPADVEVASGTVHVVRHGDTLSAIAKRHGVTVPMLYTANGLLNDRLTPGQHLVIPTTR